MVVHIQIIVLAAYMCGVSVRGHVKGMGDVRLCMLLYMHMYMYWQPLCVRVYVSGV
jgi:hypothetical protein